MKMFLALYQLTWVAVSLADSSTCDQAYSKREDLLSAGQCYRQLLPSDLNQESDEKKIKTTLEKALISLSGVVSDSPRSSNEQRAIELGQAWSAELTKRIPESADAFYWTAVWLSFQVRREDRGALIPRRTLRAIAPIQAGLRQAIDVDPSIHLFGPHRVLGTLHTEMPAIAGGNKQLAEQLLRVAYEGAPLLSANHVAYAKILIINNQTSLAEQVLRRFLGLKDEELNPYPNDLLRFPRVELNHDRKEGRKMLEELLSEQK